MLKSFWMLFFLSGMSFAGPKPILLPEDFFEKFKSFEPSAGFYAPDLGGYLIASDDTDEEDRPYLFLMNSNGVVEASLKVDGLKKMTDLESISDGENGILYLLSSLGVNKNGVEKPERNWFVEARRSGRNISVVRSIQLRSVLLKALEDLDLPDLEDSLDVESHFVMNGELYLGLKNPQPEGGKALLLKLGSIDKLFKSGQCEKLEVWKTIDFSSLSNEEDLLSDVRVVNGVIYLTSTTEAGTGRFWRLDSASEKLQLLETFDDLKPEGLALSPNGQELLMLFDQGDEDGLFSFVRLPNTR